jgi:hypothetical protein
MPVTARILEALIESELATVSDKRVLGHIRGMLVEPHVVLCNWDYGEPGQQYPCWFVLRDAHSGGEIAYCEYGFGPRCPWGLVSFGREEKDRSIGMDSGWFTTFLDAFFESVASIELPIWRVFRVEADGTRTALTEEFTWDATWSRISELRNGDPTIRFECNHSIKFGQPIGRISET